MRVGYVKTAQKSPECQRGGHHLLGATALIQYDGFNASPLQEFVEMATLTRHSDLVAEIGLGAGQIYCGMDMPIKPKGMV